jgi:hypothetical protein
MKANLGILIATILGAAHLNAGTIYNTFGSGDSYETGSGSTLGLGNLFGNGGYSDAFEFTPTTSGSVDDILTAIQYIYEPGLATGPNELDVWLMSDDSGSPGSIIESFEYTGTSGSSNESVITLQSTTHPYLSAGTEYWLAAAPVDLLNSWFVWQNNDQGITGSYAQRVGSGSWMDGTSDINLPAFEITSEIVSTPEPNLRAFLLAALGMVFVFKSSASIFSRK